MPRQNTPPADYPQAVLQQIEQLAQNIVIARKRRGESQAQWARKLGISQPTMARIERGDPSVAMASYVMCMWLINQAGGLADLIAPQNDHAALEKEVAKVRAKRKPRESETSNSKLPHRSDADAHKPLPKLDKLADRTRSNSGERSEFRRVVEAARRLSNLEQPATSEFQKAVEAARRLSDLTQPAPSEFRKAVEAAQRHSHLTLADSAPGLAALLAKTDPKKK